METWEEEVTEYSAYVQTLDRLLSLTRERLLQRLEVKRLLCCRARWAIAIRSTTCSTTPPGRRRAG
jgi:hypothetical protein